MNNMWKMTVLGALAGTLGAGCVSYTGVVGPGDSLVDENNREYARQAAETFAQRQKFRRPVVIQEAEGVNLFLSPSYVPRSNNPRANILCGNIEARRTMLQSAKATLREIVTKLKDLELTGEAATPLVAVSSGEAGTAPIYRITYNISNLDLQLRESEALFSLKRPASSHENKIFYTWNASATVEVRMIDPNGNVVFNFNAAGTVSQEDDGSLEPNVTMLEQAAANGIKEAMREYAHKFGPPIYVTDTCQDGEFVRLSVGADYGIRPGMKVEFLCHRSAAALDGAVKMVEQRVGTGTVGKGGAPVEPGCAWAYVDGYDAEKRTVFQWTSARLIRGTGSTSSIASLGGIEF